MFLGLRAHEHAYSLFSRLFPIFPTPRGSLDIETAKLKVVGQKGGFQPRQIRTVKDGHICVMMCAPVEGPPCQPLFCFAGSENERDMAKGSGEDVRWVKTPNGWPDAKALITWGHMMVAHKEKQGLEKMLIFCDNADTHMNVELNHLFSQHNIRLFGLIPSSTHATQPLDLNFFGLVKPMIEDIASKENVLLTSFNVAYYWTKAVKELQRRRAQSGKSLLTDGFKAAGIYPFDPTKSLPKTAYAQAVYQHKPAEVQHAAKVGKLAGDLEVADIEQVLDDGIAGKVTGATMALQPLSERAKEERIKLAGQKRKRKGEAEEPMDDKQRAEYFLSTHSYTSEAFGRKKAASEKAAADEAAAVAERKVARAAEKVVKDVQAEEAKKARLAKKAAKAKEREAAAAAADARKAARLMKKAAKGMPAAPQAAVAGKRVRKAEEQVEFGPPKKKRAGK